MKHLLKVKNLTTSFDYDGKRYNAIDMVDFHIDRGEIIGIVGESGSGKSVTMLSCLQLISSPGKIETGEIYLEGINNNLLDYSSDSEIMRSVRGGRISMIFQEPMTSLNPVLTVGYQICENILNHRNMKPAQAKNKAIEYMQKVNIPDAKTRFDYYPRQFSGGMRQRVMIAMAMASCPDLLICDEATTALDVTTQAQLLEMIKKIAKESNTAVILVTHNMGLVARYAERVYVMYSGKMMETASCKNIFINPQHPYTRALLRAIPRLDDTKDRVLIPIDGTPPTASERKEYCAFYKRCEYREDRCIKHSFSSMVEVMPNHYSACCLTKEELQRKKEELLSKDYAYSPIRHVSSEVCLRVENIKKTFPVFKGVLNKKSGQVKALTGISFILNQGETLGIVGESGCGKTTLARCITKMYEPDYGKIIFKGIDITHLSEKQLLKYRSQISMIFQDPFSSLDPRQRAGSIVGESLLIHNIVSNKKEYDIKVDDLFCKVGLDPAMKYRYAHEFSGGQRQRIGIARALSSNPSLIICDEPISALDVSIQAQIINLLEKIQSETGVSFIFISHDLAVVKHISDRIIVMYLGSAVEISTCSELYKNPLHPYTKALLSAIPIADPSVEEKRKVIPIKGEAQSLVRMPSGCPFYNRCTQSMAICKSKVPALQNVSNDHMVSCHLYI